jgi:hypothetical protein
MIPGSGAKDAVETVESLDTGPQERYRGERCAGAREPIGFKNGASRSGTENTAYTI